MRVLVGFRPYEYRHCLNHVYSALNGLVGVDFYQILMFYFWSHARVFLKFFAKIWSPNDYDVTKLSKHSLEVFSQDSNIILNFWDDFWFLWAPASTDLTSKMALGSSLTREKWPHREKMSIFQSLLYFHHNVTTGKETSY